VTKETLISYVRQYRVFLLAAALFLVLDLSVVALNFYTSFQIDQDAVAINLAGRQRYVSQRVARTLWELDADRTARRRYRTDTIEELRDAADIFQRSMLAFRGGGIVPGGDNRPVELHAVTTPSGREIQDEIAGLWNPYYVLVQLIVGKPEFTGEELTAVLAYSRANNLPLLAAANDFVTETQAIGASRASWLRTIQTAGILLLLLKFAGVMFVSLRRLLRSDRQAAAEQRETVEILRNVKEGLLLIDPAFRIRSQYSASLPAMLGRPIEPGTDFRALLKDLVAPPVHAAACDYIDMLFGDRVKEALITQLNPLNAVKVAVPSSAAAVAHRYLTLQFNRVLDGGKVSYLLVTISDVTAQVELERALEAAEQKSRSLFEVPMVPRKVNPAPAIGS
jgi:two-component system chemotaxis sensor kinase CheA